MTVFHAIILGVVQGLGEFIPISSSAHLLLFPWFFGWSAHSLTFDVALHLGTAVALVSYFGRDWWQMIVGFVKGCRRRKDAACKSGLESNGYMVLPIVFACVPAAVVGMLFEHKLEVYVRQSHWMPLIVAGTLAGLGLVLYAAEVVGTKKRKMDEMNAWDWATIGIAQAFALVPGVSRSGSTITMGLFRNLRREDAAYFSFLLSAPIIFGAAGLKLTEVAKQGLPHGEIIPFIAGTVTATIVGYLCLGFLMSFLKKHSVSLFVWYRIALAAVIVGVWIFRA